MDVTPSTDKTLIGAFRRHARERPQDLFCTIRWEESRVPITFETLFTRAAAYGRRLTEAGLGRGDIAIVVMPHGPDLVFAFLGAMLAGCTPAFLAPPSEKQDPALYRDMLAKLLAHSGARVVLAAPETVAEIGHLAEAAQALLLGPEDGTVALDGISWPAPDPDDVAFLQFSSGTTGLRKGVMLTHRIVMEQVRTYAAALRLDPGRDHVVSWLPLYHDMGLIACFVMPLATGTPLTLIDAFDWVYEPGILFEEITRQRGTLAWLPNFAFNHLARTVKPSKDLDLSGMRAFINCSEPCKIASMRGFATAFAPIGVREDQLQTCYAMAEAVFAVTQSALGERARHLEVDPDALAQGRVVPGPTERTVVAVDVASVGALLPGFELRVLSPGRRHQVAGGDVGEIALRGPSVFGGYHRSPETSREVFDDGWFLTGDLGFVRDGHLYVTGRIKDVIIAYGKNFYAHDIEAAVSSVEGVKPGRAVAFGVYSEIAGSEEVVVVAETEVTDKIERKQITRAIKLQLAERLDLAVRNIQVVEPKWLIKTSSGKISRSLNSAKYLSQQKCDAQTDNISLRADHGAD